MSEPMRIALVTGTSSGIGAKLAEALLDDDWAVVGMARRSAEIEHAHYRHLRFDLGDLDAISGFADERLRPLLEEDWARVGLVNNAAIVGDKRGLERTDPGELDRVLAINTVAPVYLMGVFVRHVRSSVPLRIVNVSTGAAGRGVPGLGGYGASKAALRIAGMALANELGSDERPGGQRPDFGILSYEPGVVDTEMQVEARSTTDAEFPWSRPFKDFASKGILERPEDVVGEIVAFLEGDPAEPFSESRFGQ